MQRPRTIILTVVLALLGSAVATGTASAASSAHFRSPSGAINCIVDAADGGFAQCIVMHAHWPSAPAKPASCDLDWDPYEVQLSGTRVVLGGCRGDVGPRCHAGSGRCTVLAYGTGITVGSIRCISATAGITCRRTRTSRPGFRIAREGVRLYR